MPRILLYEKDIKLQARMVAELAKYVGQFSLQAVRSLEQAHALLRQRLISLCVMRADMGNREDLEFIATCSAQYPQVPFILLTEEFPGDRAGGAAHLNVLQVINPPFASNAIADAILDGLDAIDEGLLWQRVVSSGAGVTADPSLSEEDECF